MVLMNRMILFIKFSFGINRNFRATELIDRWLNITTVSEYSNTFLTFLKTMIIITDWLS
jgi:hypothetical protein